MLEVVVELGLKAGISARCAIGGRELENQRHQSLGDKSPAINAEMAALVWPAPEGVRDLHPGSSPERVGSGEKSADLVEILFAGTALDTGRDIDRCGTGNPYCLRQQFGGQATRQHPFAAPGSARDQLPVEGEAVAARQRVPPARRLRVKQQQAGGFLVSNCATHVLRRGDCHRLHYWPSEA